MDTNAIAGFLAAASYTNINKKFTENKLCSLFLNTFEADSMFSSLSK